MSDDESADDETRPGGSGATDLSPPEERGLPSFDEEDEVDETDIDDDLFEEMDVEGSPGDAGAWEALTEGEVATESPEDIDGEVRTISDRTCHGCRFFADPPETACTHSGTEINRVVDTDHFEVVDCPMVVTAIDVATDETADGRLDSPETGDVDDAEVGAIDQGSTDESADPVDDTNGLIDIRDTTADDTAGDATAADAPESVDSGKSGGEPAAPDESEGDAADDLPDESDEDIHAVDEPSDGGSLTGDETSTASDGTTSGSEDGDDGFADPADSTRNDVDESDAERESDTVDGADDPADMDDLRDVADGEDVDEPGEERVEVERDRDDATDPADTASDSAGESVAPDEISWGDDDADDDDPDGDADEDDDLSIGWANDDE